MNEYVSYMTESVAIWLLGGLAAWCIALSLAVYSLRIVVVKLQVASDIFVGTLSENLSKALHAKDNHTGLDVYLDKLNSPFRDWSVEQWIELKAQCDRVAADGDATTADRCNAGMLSAVCVYEALIRFNVKLTVIPAGNIH